MAYFITIEIEYQLKRQIGKRMKKVLIINTGGTFNKIYNPLTGLLDIDTKETALNQISKAWINPLEVINIINKDSLDMTQKDRLLILKTVQKSSFERIIIIHGTDTMDQTAQYLYEKKLEKMIILTGAMVPFSINPIEATANFASAYGFLQGLNKHGVFIAMNGKIELHQILKKNRERGYFELKEPNSTTAQSE